MTDRFETQLREVAAAMGDEAPDAPTEIPSTALDDAPVNRPVGLWKGIGIAAGTAAAALVVVGGIQLLMPNSGPVGSEPAPVTSTQPATTAQAQDDAAPEGVPYLLLEAEGWEIDSYADESYEPDAQATPIVFRKRGAVFGDPTILVTTHTDAESPAMSDLDGTEPVIRVESEVRVIVVTSATRPVRTEAGVDYADGPLVIVRGFGMRRDVVEQTAEWISVSTEGETSVTPPPGYEQVSDVPTYVGPATHRAMVYAAPDHASAEISIWTGTSADIELQAYERLREAKMSRAVTVGGVAGIVAYPADIPSRAWVVGGRDGFVFEMSFDFGGTATDVDVDTILSGIRFVDQSTFENALPDGPITREEGEEAAEELLADVPLPPGSDRESVIGVGGFVGATVDRDVHIAQLSGTVACAWIEEWADAVAKGDADRVEAAADALAMSRDWTMLIEIDDQSDLPELLWEYADAVAGDGTVGGGGDLTVQESYLEALGCAGG